MDNYIKSGDKVYKVTAEVNTASRIAELQSALARINGEEKAKLDSVKAYFKQHKDALQAELDSLLNLN